jgi:hypothetical protein
MLKTDVLGRATAPALVLAMAVLLAGCSCRGSRAGPPPERFVPASVDLALVVPEAARAAREVAALHAAVASFPGAPDLVQARGALTAQLGFDPLDPDALADAGLDPRRGAAVAAFAAGGAGTATLLVLPVKDREKLDASFARIARDRLGAAERSSATRGALAVTVFAPAPGAPPALALAIVDRTALVAAGPAAVDLVAAAAVRPPEESLAESAAWKQARGALADRYAAIVFAPPGSRRLAGWWAVKDGLAVATSGGAAGVRIGVAVLLGDREASFRALAADGAARAIVARLDPRSPIALRFDGDPATLGTKLLPMLPRREKAALAARGIDLQRDLFDALAPGAAGAVALFPGLDLTALSEDAVRADPLLVARFEAVLPLKDSALALAASERLAPAPRPRRAPHGRAAAPAPAPAHDPAGGGGRRTFRVATPTGELAWTVDAEARRVVAAGGPPGALDALLARLEGAGPGFEPPTKDAAAALAGGLGGVVVDARKLVASVRALPDEAFGSGPSGFVVRSVVGRFLEPAARLSAVSLRAELADGALVLALDAEAATGAAP